MSKKRATAAADDGIGLVIAISILTFVSFLGLYMAVGAVTEMRLSDNFESQLQARAAALGGLHHARELLPGLSLDGLLQGPDGAYSATASYLAQARSFGFRNPLSWSAAGSCDIEDPASAFLTLPDDGVIHSGRPGGHPAIVLIPQTGTPWVMPNPHGSGTVCLSRYFVKVTDNNGEPYELAGDPANNPFVDGDGVIVVRSLGISRTLAEPAGASIRRNSIAVYEARFRRRATFDLTAPLAIVGSGADPVAARMFEGGAFLIEGGAHHAGIAAIDTDTADGRGTAGEILAGLEAHQAALVQGNGLTPSVRDDTAGVVAHQDRRLLLDRDYLLRFARRLSPAFADRVFQGSQNWTSGAPVNLGRYDPDLPANSPGQDPGVTWVDGDLLAGDGVEGGGMLIVTGRLTITGGFVFSGLVLLIGAGELDASGCEGTVKGGILLAGVSGSPGSSSWKVPGLSVGGGCALVFHREAVKTGVALIPPSQTSFREITSTIDP